MDTIRKIRQQGFEVGYRIIRHGLTENEAFEVESALIDYVGLENLYNVLKGHASDERGSMEIAEIIEKYDAPAATITEPVILITINQQYQKNMSAEALYEATRCYWKIGSRREKVRYAFAVYHGIIRQVYRVERWLAVDPDHKYAGRWCFEGTVADELSHYIGQSTVNYSASQNPIRYININK